MENIIKASAIVLTALAASAFVGRLNKDMNIAVRLAAAVVLFGIVIGSFGEQIDHIWGMIDSFHGESFLTEGRIMLKALGVASITGITADICRDAGEGSLAGGIEGVGKLAIIALCLPMAEEIIMSVSALLSSA